MTDYTATPIQRMRIRKWEAENSEKIHLSKIKWNNENRGKIKEMGHRHIRVGDKQIYLKFNPRTGICSECGKERRTHMHHFHYNPLEPLVDTIELCIPCHRHIHSRGEQS